MGDPVVTVEPVTAAVEPGGQARVVVTVVNEGTIVEGYRVDVLDDVTGTAPDVAGPASWFEVLPGEGSGSGGVDEPDVTVYPGQQQSVVVVFSPPTGTRVPGGRCAFGIRVSSVVDPDASTVVEGDLDIGKVSALQASIVPVTSTGRWKGRHVVQLSNWGNTPARLSLVADDPDRALGFLVHPETVELPVGASQPVRLRVRTRRPRLRGTAARLPFTVRAHPAEGVPGPPASPGAVLPPPDTVTVDGAFTQKPILTTGAVLGAGLLLAAVAGLTAYGLTQRSSTAQTYEELGPPATPEVSVEATGPESVRVSWAPLEDVEGYRLYRLDDQGASMGVEDLDPGLGAMPVEGLVADQEYCFAMRAFRGEAQSPESDQACARTEEAVAAPTTVPPTAPPEETDAGPTEAQSPTEEQPTETEAENGSSPTTVDPTGTAATETATATTNTTAPTVSEPGAFAPGDWVSVLATFPAQGSGGEFAATERAEELVGQGVAALAIDTGGYPDLGLAQQGWLVVIEDGYDSSAQAAAACQEVRAAVPDLVTFCDPPIQPVLP